MRNQQTTPPPPTTEQSGAPPLAPVSPRIFTGTIAAAYESALDANEPVFVPAAIFSDDRGWSLLNQFQGVLTPQGQINYGAIYPGVVKAWHRHQHQTDFWCCVTGDMKAGVYREDDGRTWMMVIGEKRPGVLIVPPPLWHGAATVGPQTAGLLYYVTRAYDPKNPDEQRRPYDSVDGFSWSVTFQ
jgi:dTDP-4-dehydrorhamnose 3,5-epimerase